MANGELEKSVGIEIYSTPEIEGISGICKHSYKDFIVKEITSNGNILEIKDDYQAHSFSEDSKDRYTTFNLIKVNKDSFEALREISQALRVPLHLIYYSGLKDKCSISVQKVSVKGNFVEKLKKLKLRDLFFRSIKPTKKAIKIGGNKGNNFTIVIRNIKNVGKIKERIEDIINILNLKGFPNYFGLQRFGTFRTNSHVVGRYLLENNYERAFNEFVTTNYSTESPHIQLMRQNLKISGDLEEFYENFPKSMKFERDMVKYLIDHPGDYKGTFTTLPVDLKNLLISAFQSYLFNKMITLRVKKGFSLFEPVNGDIISILDDDKGYITQIKYKYGERGGRYDKYLKKAIKLNRATIVVPIVGYETDLDELPLIKAVFEELIEQEGIDKNIFRSNVLRDIEFKGAIKAMTVKPIGLKVIQFEDDDIFPDKKKLKIEYSLPKGSYATVLLRELMK